MRSPYLPRWVGGPRLIIHRGKICIFYHFRGHDGVGWAGVGANNVLLLHPRRRVFSRMRGYVMGWGGVG